MSISHLDTSMLVRRARRLFRLLGVTSSNTYVAGGFIRDNLLGRTPSDIDVFTQNESDWTSMQQSLTQVHNTSRTYREGMGSTYTLRRGRLRGFHLPVDIIYVSHDVYPIEDVIRYCFDYTVNTIGINMNGDIIYHPNALRDLLKGNLQRPVKSNDKPYTIKIVRSFG